MKIKDLNILFDRKKDGKNLYAICNIDYLDFCKNDISTVVIIKENYIIIVRHKDEKFIAITETDMRFFGFI